MNDNRLHLNLSYTDSNGQFLPLLTIVITQAYNTFLAKSYLLCFEYLNLFQLFLQNGANPLKKGLSFKTHTASMTQISHVLYGLFPMTLSANETKEDPQIGVRNYVSYW